VVRIEFRTEPPPSPLAPGYTFDASGVPIEGPRPIPTATYVFGGLALAAASVGAFFAVTGLADRNEKAQLRADGGCAPTCTSEEIDSTKRSFLIADIGFGTAVASAGLATLFYLTRPVVLPEDEESEEVAKKKSRPKADAQIGPGFVGLSVGGRF
jgi:hypothetical protein